MRTAYNLAYLGLVVMALLGAVPAFAGHDSSAAALPALIHKHSRPDTGRPTQVAVGLFLRDLEEINLERETFEASAYLTLTWKDPRLAFTPGPGEPAKRVYNPNAIWSPDPFFVNAMGHPSLEEPEVEVLPDGTAEYRAMVDGTFFAPYNLRRYPFDTQELRLEIRSEDYDESEVAFVVDPAATGKHAGSSLVEWTIGQVSTGTEVVSNHGVPEKLDKIFHGSQYHFMVPITRRPAFYLWSVMLPLGLFVFLSWAVAWSKTFESATVVASIPTLAYVTFNIVIIIESPRVGYMTFLNAGMIAGYVLITLSIMDMMIRHILEQGSQTRRVETIAKTVRWLLPTLSLVAMAILAVDFLR